MKIFLSLFLLINCYTSIAQKSEFFKGIDFDSSYSVVGIVQGNSRLLDSLPQYWFFLDNPADMIELKKEWVFKKEVSRIHIELPAIEIYTLRNKMEVLPASIIFPRQGIIKSGNSWYRMDVKEIEKLHNAHPLHYHSQKFQFVTHQQYISVGNSLLKDSNLLFFIEAPLKFEGKFFLYAKRTNDPNGPDWYVSDVDKALRTFAEEDTYESGLIDNDTFNIAHKDRTRFTIWGSKSLYDKFESKDFEKGDWTPAFFGMKVFWRD